MGQLFFTAPKQQYFNPKLTYVWKVDGMSPKKIGEVIDQMYICYSCYIQYGTTLVDVCRMLIPGFIGTLKQCMHNRIKPTKVTAQEAATIVNS